VLDFFYEGCQANTSQASQAKPSQAKPSQGLGLGWQTTPFTPERLARGKAKPRGF